MQEHVLVRLAVLERLRLCPQRCAIIQLRRPATSFIGKALSAMTSPLSAPLSGHETGKQERRNRIVEAAADLVRENGFDGASVEVIARRAGVSPATVYNLFGNKAGVFDQVFDADMTQFEALVAARVDVGPIGLIFEALDIATGLYAREPDYYKALMRLSQQDGPLYVSFSRPRQAFWIRLFRQIHTSGALRPDLDHEAAATTLAAMVRGAIDFWVEGRLDSRQLHRNVAYGFGLVLLSMVTCDARDEVLRRMNAPQSDA